LAAATGQVWVDSSPNLDAARNGAWFFLRHRYHHNKALQAEWNTHGEEAFQYEILEQLDERRAGFFERIKDSAFREQETTYLAQIDSTPVGAAAASPGIVSSAPPRP
jgi:hypothetical protein